MPVIDGLRAAATTVQPGALRLLFVLLAIPSARIADAVSARARRRQQSGSLL